MTRLTSYLSANQRLFPHLQRVVKEARHASGCVRMCTVEITEMHLGLFCAFYFCNERVLNSDYLSDGEYSFLRSKAEEKKRTRDTH